LTHTNKYSAKEPHHWTVTRAVQNNAHSTGSAIVEIVRVSLINLERHYTSKSRTLPFCVHTRYVPV